MSRVDAILGHLAEGGDGRAFDAVCAACVRELPVTGAALALIIGEHPLGSLGVSDPTSRALQDAQYRLGEGPCLEAARSGQLVAEPSLAPYQPRWPLFSALAARAGVQAAFAVPLHAGAASLGALGLYRDAPGPLTTPDIDDLLRVAAAASTTILALQARSAPAELMGPLDDLLDQRAAVHQAVGMVSVQLDVGIDDAWVALRARAFRMGISELELAEAVVARRIRLDGDP